MEAHNQPFFGIFITKKIRKTNKKIYKVTNNGFKIKLCANIKF